MLPIQRLFLLVALLLMAPLTIAMMDVQPGAPGQLFIPLVIGPVPTAEATPTTEPTATAEPTPTESPVVPIPTPTATVQPTPEPTQAPQGPCPCDRDVMNCSHFRRQGDAQACLDWCKSLGRGDIHRLDGDGNGVACESLPRWLQ